MLSERSLARANVREFWLAVVAVVRVLGVDGDQLTDCRGCGEATPTINGKCPNCWHAKTNLRRVSTRRYNPNLLDRLFDDPSDSFLLSWLPVPTGVILLIVGIAIDAPALLALGGVLVALRLAVTLLP